MWRAFRLFRMKSSQHGNVVTKVGIGFCSPDTIPDKIDAGFARIIRYRKMS